MGLHKGKDRFEGKKLHLGRTYLHSSLVDACFTAFLSCRLIHQWTPPSS